MATTIVLTRFFPMPGDRYQKQTVTVDVLNIKRTGPSANYPDKACIYLKKADPLIGLSLVVDYKEFEDELQFLSRR